MSVAFDKPSWWQRIKPVFEGFDLPLILVVMAMCAIGLVTMYSAGYDNGTRFVDQSRNMLLAALVLFTVAQIPPQKLMALAVPLYVLGVILLILVAIPHVGITKKGATRWLNVGMVIQPSEVLKIAMPLLLAWWFQRREGQLRALDFAVAGGLLLLPVALVLKQPDLGTAMLVLSSGLYVIFFAGLSWRLIVPVILVAAVGVTLIVSYEAQLCQAGVQWPGLHDYQKNRVCT